MYLFPLILLFLLSFSHTPKHSQYIAQYIILHDGHLSYQKHDCKLIHIISDSSSYISFSNIKWCEFMQADVISIWPHAVRVSAFMTSWWAQLHGSGEWQWPWPLVTLRWPWLYAGSRISSLVYPVQSWYCLIGIPHSIVVNGNKSLIHEIVLVILWINTSQQYRPTRARRR